MVSADYIAEGGKTARGGLGATTDFVGLEAPEDVSGLGAPRDVTGLGAPGDAAGLGAPGDVTGLGAPGDAAGLGAAGDVTGLGAPGAHGGRGASRSRGARGGRGARRCRGIHGGRGVRRGRGARGGPNTQIRGRGRGRTSAPKRPRNFIPSTLPWEKFDPNTDQSPRPLAFTSPTGPIVPMTPTSRVEDFFDHFFDQDFLGLILEETTGKNANMNIHNIEVISLHTVYKLLLTHSGTLMSASMS